MYVHVLYNKIHLLKNLRMKQPVQVNPGLNCSFSYENCIIYIIYIYTEILEVNLFAFAYVEISPHSTGHIAICPVEWGEISTKQSVGKCKQINF